jgi:hypothetical protein
VLKKAPVQSVKLPNTCEVFGLSDASFLKQYHQAGDASTYAHGIQYNLQLNSGTGLPAQIE